ncbi:hypothetical protein GCM10020358_56740 [Amorphoplanes nipponensis]|uniref:Anti-sigma regulatory factor (Ser/Thr protein kinase) n=1 Tax=Actinoplanes nipponensis TaxID=135950 RepID=A0A919JJ31_9ACTN|nr:ATP-binding protein [Actinoplanes nipponensis]GIE47709.1 hypothetical protein Ani05nite_12430 [Actinoplanes nipponensis]
MPGELRPPYLIGRAPAGGDGRVSVTADVAAGAIEVAVHGRWSPSLRLQAWTAVSKCFVEHPPAVLVDLHGLEDPLAASAPAWWTMGMTGVRMAPPVTVVVCLPPAARLAGRLNQLGARRYLPVYATMPRARDAVAARLPLTERVQARLAPEREAAGRACALVADACVAWRLTPLRAAAELIVTELVHNAVRHAGTGIVVTLSRRGAGVHLAVNDDDPRLPVPDPALREPGDGVHGLAAVHAAATAWGAMPTSTGKVVWAVVRAGRS